jgi:hypothetical protein
MKTKIVGLLISVITLMGCQRQQVLIPAFEIRIDLDERAERELRARNETINVSLEVSGRPRKDSGIRENNKASGIVLGFFEKELDSEGVIRFEGLKIPEKLYRALENKDYGVSVSVRSGWKSSKFNLLNCEPFGTGINEVAGKQHTIKCKLIKDMWE